MAQKLKFEAYYPFPLEQVWIALTDPAAIGEWLMPTTFEPRVGHRFTFTTKPAPGFDGVVQCQVLELRPNERLSYSWKGGGIDTVVSFDLAGDAAGTRLVMEQVGFTGLRGLMISKILGGGWKRMVETRLPAAAGRVRNGSYHAAPDAPESRCDE